MVGVSLLVPFSSSKLPFWDFSPLTFRFNYGFYKSVSGILPGDAALKQGH